MLEIVEHPVHLVKLPLGVAVLDSQLVAVGLADGAALVRPGVPDVLDRSWMLLDFFCQIHKSSSTALLKAILRMVCTGNSARRS